MLRTSIQRKYENTHIDMTPMVDCVMVLLVFLMISSAFVQEPGIEVEKPNVTGGETADRNALLIAISATNHVFFDGQELQLDQVAGALKQAAVDRDPVLVIMADKAASHGVFAAVYSEAKRAGIPHVQFSTAPEPSP
ncbi:MAG TPA: biopolymer transporter ExbD [Opitutaceae bacterium]|nr:biopolymer transporter ExbD [Opitutaceae bacterium]